MSYRVENGTRIRNEPTVLPRAKVRRKDYKGSHEHYHRDAIKEAHDRDLISSGQVRPTWLIVSGFGTPDTNIVESVGREGAKKRRSFSKTKRNGSFVGKAKKESIRKLLGK